VKRLVVALLAAAALAGAGPARADVYDDRPAAASRGAGDMVVVARGVDGALYERHLQSGAWTPWASIGGQATSGPAAVAYGDAIHVFALGLDGAVWQTTLHGGSWAGWSSLGGGGTSAPAAVVRRGTATLDLAVRGTDNAIHMRTYQPDVGWSGWGTLGENLGSGPSLESFDTGILDVWARAADGSLAQKLWNGTAWSDWSGLGGGLDGSPAAVSRAPGHVDVFVRGTDRALHQRYWSGAAGWSSWSQLDTAPLDSAPAVAADTSNHLALFARRGAGVSVKEWSGDAGWTAWADLGAVAPPPPPPPDGNVELTTGLRCTPPGGRLKVSLKVRRRAGRARPRIRRVVFFVRGGPRSVDRRRPYVRRLVLHRPAGSTGRVYARAVYTREGSKKLRRKTVSKRYVMCG
jgi:hypothetical protein